MGRIAQPREIAILKGADKRNPGRYRGEVPKSDFELGVAPDFLTDRAKTVWFEIETFAPAGILTGADRHLMELTCELLAEFCESPREFTAAKHGRLVAYIAHLGLTPASRQKLAIAKPKELNPYLHLED